MFRSLKKAAQSLERGMETTFSTAPTSHVAYLNKTLQIGSHNVRLGPVFAEGGYSFLHTATPVPSTIRPTRFAVKRLPVSDPDLAAAADREIAFLSVLPPHPNIPRFYAAAIHDNHAFLLFELIDGGTLPEVLSRAQTPLSPRARLDILADATAAVVHLHALDPPVAMRDVKLENLLYDRLDGTYKLCDFGSVTSVARRCVSRKEMLDAEEDISNCCTDMYLAPELVDLYAKHFICERVDVWALGCVWYALLFGKLPFDGLSSLQILKGLQHVPTEPVFPDGYIALLKAMLTVSPAERADSFTVLEAIRRLQGSEIGSELKRTGNALRSRRVRDFANDGAVRPEMGANAPPDLLGLGNSGDITTKAAEDYPGKQQAPLIDFGAFSSETNHPQPTPVPNTIETHNEDNWADFESAFGSQSSLPPKPLSSLVQHLAPMNSKATSLLDLSDLHISSSKPMQRANAPDRPPARARPKAARSASDFCDLIDFSEQT